MRKLDINIAEEQTHWIRRRRRRRSRWLFVRDDSRVQCTNRKPGVPVPVEQKSSGQVSIAKIRAADGSDDGGRGGSGGRGHGSGGEGGWEAAIGSAGGELGGLVGGEGSCEECARSLKTGSPAGH